MLTIKWSDFPEQNVDGNTTETIVSNFEIEDAEVEQLTNVVQDKIDQGLEVTVTIKFKEPKN